MRKMVTRAVLYALIAAGCGGAEVPAGTDSSGLPPPAASTGAAGGDAPVLPPTLPGATAGAPATAAPVQTPPVGTNVGTPPVVGTPNTTPPPTAPTDGTAPVANVPGGPLPMATGAAISEACRGFEFTGLVNSPGGDVPPNKCEAFHPTLNNQYAVRCVDAWPWYKTDFPGDNFCILPPPAGKGIQVGHHPHGQGDAWFKAVSTGDMSGYTSVPADWRLPPGGEEERNINIAHTNEGGKYYRIYSRMRGGSHHMIPSVTATGALTGTWGPGGADGLFNGGGYPGAQRPDDNAPQSPSIPEEDRGLYREFPANAVVTYNMHHFNSMDKDILKEVWQNIWWTDEATTLVNNITGLPVTQVASIFANPGEIADMHYASTALAPARVLGLFGHRHAWTTAFTAWIESAGKEPQILYQSLDWFDEPTYTYNSEVKNPAVAPEKRTDGAASGVVMLNAGDSLHFNCHIEYTDERAIQENSPVKPSQNGPLRFANQAFEAEMCILFGASVGDVGLLEQLGPPPDFAKVR
jgi:hypothetical protein